MRLIGKKGARAATAPSRLLGMTCMASVDGTIPLLAAQGALGSPLGAATIGITIVAGMGAWVAAWQAFPGRPGAKGVLLLSLFALVNMAVTVAAAAVGAHVAGDLAVLPKAAGLVILLIAAEVGGIRLPRVGALGLPSIAVLASLALEVLLWIP